MRTALMKGQEFASEAGQLPFDPLIVGSIVVIGAVCLAVRNPGQPRMPGASDAWLDALDEWFAQHQANQEGNATVGRSYYR